MTFSPISSSQTQPVPWVYCRSSFLSAHRENNRYRHFKWTDLPQERRGLKVWFSVLSRLFSVPWSSLKHRAFFLSVCEDSPWASVCQWPYPCTSSYHTCPWWRSLQTGPSRASGSTRVRKPRRDVWLWRFPSPEHTGGSEAQQIMANCSNKAKTQHPGCFSRCMWRSPHDKTSVKWCGKRKNQDADDGKTITLGSIMLTGYRWEGVFFLYYMWYVFQMQLLEPERCHKCLIQGFVF